MDKTSVARLFFMLLCCSADLFVSLQITHLSPGDVGKPLVFIYKRYFVTSLHNSSIHLRCVRCVAGLQTGYSSCEQLR